MIVSTILILTIYLYKQLDKQHHGIPVHLTPVYHYDLDQSVCGPLLVFDHVYLKMPSSISEILGHEVDPKAPLSNIDLAQLLMNDSSTKVRELRDNIKEVINSDRDHNKIVVQAAVTGICSRLNDLEELVLKCKTDHYNAVEDLDLKLSTITTFEEEHITSLQSKVYGLSLEVQNHKKICQDNSNHNNCVFCGTLFPSKSDLTSHIMYEHTNQACFPCASCGKRFLTEKNLRDHLPECAHTDNHSRSSE